ncbi:related to Oxidoreductase, short-chain dehydrogenase [Rhynchosporium agropyri]|uniref:Related to Oxidoreductase, short-chain dehydrogenase n=1 Tax=Rhynchosporium agropyri TaxID=914238 RepID=A0A1E1LHI7_9HELO|nr:related to Oxidoreductase, short-chain dehydrogenase [Rhynchosporium agropyri]
MGNAISQMFPPAAKFTEKEVPDQTGKVFIVTGSSSGVGKELAQILYAHNAKIYIAARSSEKASKAIESIKTACPNSKGSLEYLHLDLDDLSTIKASAEEFLSKEKRLDVLWNNAGVMRPPQGSKTKQGYESQLGTNCVAPFLFTKLLTPILKSSARENAPASTRVVWVSSSAAEFVSPKGGVDLANLDYKKDQSAMHKYGVSKAGNLYHAKEFAKIYGGDGIVSVALNPGNLKTELGRYNPGQNLILKYILHTPIHGAYTELFAGLSPDVTSEHNGAWIIPWGRFGHLRADLEAGSKSIEEGGTGIANKFWDWSEDQVRAYL